MFQDHTIDYLYVQYVLGAGPKTGVLVMQYVLRLTHILPTTW